MITVFKNAVFNIKIYIKIIVFKINKCNSPFQICTFNHFKYILSVCAPCQYAVTQMNSKWMFNELPLLNCVVTDCHGDVFANGPQKMSIALQSALFNLR